MPVDAILGQQDAEGQHAATGLEQKQIQDEGNAHGLDGVTCGGGDV